MSKLCEVLDCQTGDLLVRVPNDDDEQANLIIEQIIQGLKPIEKKGEIKSSHPKGYSPSHLKSQSSLAKSA